MMLDSRRLMLAVAFAWAALHLAFLGQFIYHDSWKHNFPMLYDLAQQSSCRGLPSWLWTPDSGTPTLIYVISTSLTQILRAPALYLLGCVHPGLVASVYYHKAVTYLGYFGLALGMYVLGRLLLQHRMSAVYLFAATLFAGLCLQAAHSDQVVTITFWFPWTAACGVLYHRHYDSLSGSRYLNLAVLFVCLQSFDQYPHFQVIAVGAAAAIYALFERRRALAALRMHWRRLWPSALVLGLTISHFLILRGAVSGYAPSLRTALVVDPTLFSESGFVQPTALIGSILPTSLLAGFEALKSDMENFFEYLRVAPHTAWSIFRLDELAFYVGVVPLVLAAVFLLRPGMARLRLGWVIWITVIFAVSLEQTRLYLFLFHYVPFFDLFRSYFLFILFVMLGVLVISAYGFDAVLTLPDVARRAVLRRAGLALFIMVLGAVIALLSMAAFDPNPLHLLLTLKGPLLRDLLITAAAYPALLYAAWPNVLPERRGLALIAVMVLSQVIYTAGTYSQVAIAQPRLFAEFGLERSELEPFDAAIRGDPNAVQRKLCAQFAECYLSRRPSVSLRRDLEGTFLRSRRGAVFVRHLSLPVAEALLGLTMPVFWTSRHLEEIDSDDSLVERLNAHDTDIALFLREVAYVKKRAFEKLAAGQDAGGEWADHVELRKLEWGRDVVRLSYNADKPVLLNASITCTSEWTASVDGKEIPLVCANVDGLLLRLPPGAGTVTLHYRDRWSDFVFDTRYVLLAIALFGIIRLAGAALRRRSAALRP
ncbi:MAG: hypothetical protein ACLQME_11505 [Alphaproteobacteria bacterium]